MRDSRDELPRWYAHDGGSRCHVASNHGAGTHDCTAPDPSTLKNLGASSDQHTILQDHGTSHVRTRIDDASGPNLDIMSHGDVPVEDVVGSDPDVAGEDGTNRDYVPDPDADDVGIQVRTRVYEVGELIALTRKTSAQVQPDSRISHTEHDCRRNAFLLQPRVVAHDATEGQRRLAPSWLSIDVASELEPLQVHDVKELGDLPRQPSGAQDVQRFGVHSRWSVSSSSILVIVHRFRSVVRAKSLGGRMVNITFHQMLIGPSASIRDAMRAIDRGAQNIALIVDDANRFVGTISDGDVRRAILRGLDLDSPASPHVNQAAITARPEDSRAGILDLMRARLVSQVPVVDYSGRVVGIHSLRELIGGEQRPNVAVIMAGGRGQRLHPLTATVPKPMLVVAGRPILERLVLHLVGFGIRQIVLAVNYLAECIESHFGDGSSFGCTISYLREAPDRPLGTGGPLAILEDRIGEISDPILVVNGDILTQFDVDSFLRHHQDSGAVATVAVATYSHEVPYGVIDSRDGLRVAALEEKPLITRLVNAGIYALEPHLVSRIPRGESYPLTNLLSSCLSRGETVAIWRSPEDWQDVGQHADLERARGRR